MQTRQKCGKCYAEKTCLYTTRRLEELCGGPWQSREERHRFMTANSVYLTRRYDMVLSYGVRSLTRGFAGSHKEGKHGTL